MERINTRTFPHAICFAPNMHYKKPMTPMCRFRRARQATCPSNLQQFIIRKVNCRNNTNNSNDLNGMHFSSNYGISTNKIHDFNYAFY